jgi:hypothetical protein
MLRKPGRRRSKKSSYRGRFVVFAAEKRKEVAAERAGMV